MLNKLYENIGTKVKYLAIGLFLFEAIGAIIIGIVMIFDQAEADYTNLIVGILVAIIGPIIALLSSWILYAFGELVADVHAVKNKYDPLAEVIEKQPQQKVSKKVKRNAKKMAQETLYKESLVQEDTIEVICPRCKENLSFFEGMSNAECPYCGEKIDLEQNGAAQ